MKILFISDVYFPRVNGVSTSIATFRHELHRLGHSTHLLAPDYGVLSENETNITRIPARPIPFDPEDRFMSYSAAMQQLDRLRAENYDIIHVQTPFVAHYLGTRLAGLLGIPCIETYHTFFEEYLHHYVPLAPRPLTRFIAQRFSRHQGNSLSGMVIPSRPMADVLKSYGITTPAEVIATGIKPDSFAAANGAAFRQKYHIAKDRPVLLYLGRVAHEKNIDFLLDMLPQVRVAIPDILLLIAGEGPARKHLESRVHDEGLAANTMFIGYLDRNTELNGCYAAADIFVFASRTETQGLVLLEAMAQGTPVVSTAELGTRDVLKEGQGVWIAQEDIADFCAKIISMQSDATARKALGNAGRIYAQGWSSTSQAEKLLSFYRSLLAQGAAQREPAAVSA